MTLGEERSHEIAKEKSEKALPSPGKGEAKRRSDTGVLLPLRPIPAEMPEGIGRELERGEGWAHLLLSALAEQLLNSPSVLQYWTTVKMVTQCRAKDLYQLTYDLWHMAVMTYGI